MIVKISKSKHPSQTQLGAAIKYCRVNPGLSPKDFADRIGVSTSELNMIEKGDAMIDLKILVHIAVCLDKSASELLAKAQL